MLYAQKLIDNGNYSEMIDVNEVRNDFVHGNMLKAMDDEKALM